jgi:hypothetical protein
MRNKLFGMARTLALSSAILSFAMPYQACAEERYICATVSEILDIQSEDCLYFVVKGDFVLEGNKDNELSICLDNGNDAARDSALVNKSFEKKKKIHILIDGSSVRKIQSDCL